MSNFATATFRIESTNNRWPSITRDRDGIPYYTADIMIPTSDDLVALQDAVTITTPKIARGGFLGVAPIDGGGSNLGEHSLTIPYSKGQPETFLAMLVTLTVEANPRTNGKFHANASWLITSAEITP